MSKVREERSALLGTSGTTLLLRAGSLGCTVLLSIALARTLGVEQFGVYSFVYALVTLIALPSQVGIPTLLVRETARLSAQGRWEDMNGLWYWSGRTILLIAAIVVLAVAAWLLFQESVDTATRGAMFAGLVLAPLIALGNARGAAMQGLNRIIRGQFPETVLRPALLLGLIVGVSFLLDRFEAPQAMWLHALAALVALILGSVMLDRARPIESRAAGTRLRDANAWRRAAVPLALVTGLQVVGNQAGIVLLGVFAQEQDVGLYKIAVSAAALAVVGLQVANVVIGPQIARLHALENRREMQVVASKGVLIGSSLTIPVVLVLGIWGPLILGWMYGPAFAPAYSALTILLIAQAINALFGSVGLLLTMTGLERRAASILGAAACIQILLSLLLIPSLGISGAALATLASTLIWNAGFWILARRSLGVDGSIVSALKAVPAT